jgi:branched-subunit amino acid ABC-type transport system permease component
MVFLFAFLAATTTGKAMRAVADNPAMADSKGIDPDRMARLAVGLGMGLSGTSRCQNTRLAAKRAAPASPLGLALGRARQLGDRSITPKGARHDRSRG